MGKLSKNKNTKPSLAQIGHGQTSMLNFFNKVPAGQSKLFNQLPPTTSKPLRVNKLSRTANKKANQAMKTENKQVTLLEKKKHSDVTTTVARKNKIETSPNQGGREDPDVIIIPETPESIASSTPSSSRKLTKYNIPETPPSTKSTSIRHKASSPSPNRQSSSTSHKPQTHSNSSTCLLNGASKHSNRQSNVGNHSQRVTGASNHSQGFNGARVYKTNSGDDVNKDKINDSDDDDDFMPIPETQFCIPETQFPVEKSPHPKSETFSSPEAEKSQSKFDNILTTYQKKVDLKVKRQSLDKSAGKTTLSSVKLNPERQESKPRNIFGLHQQKQEAGKSAQKLFGHSNSASNSERKMISAKRLGNKLSRTHRKLTPSGLGKTAQNSCKVNLEKSVCLDQMDLDLLQDCVTENAVVIAPKSLKISSKPKVKSRKVSPVQKATAGKQLSGLEDVDCSILEDLLEEIPDSDTDDKLKDTSILKPSKVVVNQVQSSLSLQKAHKDKVTDTKIGSQKRSPSRGNSPYAKRIQNEPTVAKPGAHVKSLFRGNHSAFDLDEIQNKKGAEKLVSLDEVDIGEIFDAEDECLMEVSQPFTGVKRQDESNRQKDTKQQEKEIDSVSAVLQKTPNRLRPSPRKAQESGGIVSPGTDGLWDALNDSFLLAAAEMEALDEMEAEAMCQTAGKSVDSQLSHELKRMSPFKSQGSTQPQVKLPADLKRYVVTSVIQEDWQKTVHVVDLCDHSSKSCILQGTWFQTPLHEGSILAIHGTFDEQGVCKITPQQNFIIVNPDLLLTGTNVTKSIKCLRRSVLGEKFKGLDVASKPMLLGTMLHEVFDEALAKKCFTVDFLTRVVQKTLKKPSFLIDMYSLGLTEKLLTQDAQEYITTMKHWADRYLQNQPKGTATMEIKFPGQMRAEKCNVCVSGIKDIEETVWSPRWGLKGKVDITAQVKIHRPQMRNPPKTYTVPLELKTGRQTNSIEHRSQVMLYSVMLADLDDQAANDLGVLLYVKTGQMLAVPAMQMDKRELLHLRNLLAYSLSLTATKSSDDKWTAPSLPEPIQDEFTCSRCNYLTSCAMLSSFDQSQGNGESPKLFTEQLAHLNPPHKDYFTHWYLMCALEHMAVEKRNTTKQIWCKDSWEREKQGDCMSGLVLSTCRHHQQRDCYLLSFKRKTNHKSVVPMSSLPFSMGDRVVVGLEDSRIVTCCIGFIETLTDDQVTIKSERALKTQVGGSYRLDKDDGYNSMASSLVNLARLMEQDNTRLRNLVVDLEKPVFDPSPSVDRAKRHHVNSILKSLNSDQQEAINRVLCSQQYTLIVGMPGTGKTTTIVGLVRILHACGLSVLLTSYTHSAVDNILLKLCKYGIDFLRLGSKHRVHPDLHKYTEDVMFTQVGSVQQLGSAVETKPVVATTCLGAKHKLLTRRVFDVCIVDEASQIGQLVCLGPLYVANRFVLVGDHQQLPPLVQSHSARKLGMDESLFQRLALHRPESSIQLSLQYRMNSAIMDISNALVYDGKLQCGNEAIAKATLDIPHWERIQKNFADKWFVEVLNPSNTVSFLNIDKVEKHSSDQEAGKSTVNHTEAEFVKILVQTLIQGGCKPSSIGVIAPYRLQCKLLSATMDNIPSTNSEVEVNTVDKYQGRDKEVIIVSFTHRQTGQDLHAGILLEDMRRLNVAVTRAKHKLILLGSVTALNKLQTMQKLLHCLENNNQISF